jgi:hypothetical protein
MRQKLEACIVEAWSQKAVGSQSQFHLTSAWLVSA